MEMSSGEWLADLANEDPENIMHHCHMMMSSHINDDGFDDEIFQPSTDYSIFATNKSFLEAKKSSINSNSWSSSGKLISFESSEFETKSEVISKKEPKNRSKRVGSTCTPNEHVVAERRRRERMSQGFVALSSLIPAGMKKMDKASILSDAAEYLKQLEERAKLLEQQTTNRTVESVYLVNKMQSQQPRVEKCFSKTINPDDLFDIEARILSNNFLIRIHSLKKDGLIRKIVEEIGKLNLTTLNFQTVPFGSYAVDITIVAQASDDSCMTTDDLVKNIGKVLQQHIISLHV